MNVATIEIRDVPEDVYEALVAEAKERGQTLNQYLIEMLIDAVKRGRALRDRYRRDPGES